MPVKVGFNHLFYDRVNEVKTLPFPESAYALSGSTNPNYNETAYRYVQSPTRQRTIFKTHFDLSKTETLKVTPIPGGHDANDYHCERIWVGARDGVKVPVTLAYRKDGKAGPRPMLLYGYGSYGYSYDAGFRSSWLSLMDRGVGIAIAHIRGGSEMGRHWYENGVFPKEKHV